MSTGPRRARHATLYDALEDRIQKHRATGFLNAEYDEDKVPRTRYAATPRNALAARLNTLPERLPSPDSTVLGKLPRTDLLNAIHGHASTLFAQEGFAFRSMSETALLAFAIIAEEMAMDSVGEHGHLMLQQGEGSALTTDSMVPSREHEQEEEVRTIRRIYCDESTNDGGLPQPERGRSKRRNHEGSPSPKLHKPKKSRPQRSFEKSGPVLDAETTEGIDIDSKTSAETHIRPAMSVSTNHAASDSIVAHDSQSTSTSKSRSKEHSQNKTAAIPHSKHARRRSGF